MDGLRVIDGRAVDTHQHPVFAENHLSGSVVVFKAGSAGGVVMLLGSPMLGGEWRFALATVDHTAELVGEVNVAGAEPPRVEWVDSWQEGLRLLDRYPWVRLYPQDVHPLFVEEVRLAVAERLAVLLPGPRREKQRKAWERVCRAAGDRSVPGLQN